jgi:hypothetical protein
MPEERKNRLIRIPKGLEWPFFKQLMDNQIGEYQWVAGFYGTEEKERIWCDNSRVPLPGQLVFVHWSYQEEKIPEDPEVKAATKKYWDQLAKTAKEACNRRREMQIQRRNDDGVANPKESLGHIMSPTMMAEVSSTEWEAILNQCRNAKFRFRRHYPQRIKQSNSSPRRRSSRRFNLSTWLICLRSTSRHRNINA